MMVDVPILKSPIKSNIISRGFEVGKVYENNYVVTINANRNLLLIFRICC